MKFRRLLNHQYLFHYLLWTFFVVSLVSDTYTAFESGPQRFFLYIGGKTCTIALLVYTTLLFIYPILFKKKKYLLFVISALLLCALVGFINANLEMFLNRGKGISVPLFLSQFTMATRYLLIAFLLQITVDYYRQKEVIKKIELEKINAELSFLKAQVNPHFLFNTLNNLYALILQKSDKSADAVLKLADIMKYILAEGTFEKVSLEKELTLLQNYTELERLRKTDAQISFTTTGDINGKLITPLLLLPFVENAFKYGLNTVSGNGFVNIEMKISGQQLYFSVENNNPPASNKEAVQSLGIGIANVKKRLDFLYPGKYEMRIAEDPSFFKIHLQLNLK
jgi:two-component system, LytTR family, sensor kinase